MSRRHVVMLIDLLFTAAAHVQWRCVADVHPDDVRAAWGGLCLRLCTRPPVEVM